MNVAPCFIEAMCWPVIIPNVSGKDGVCSETTSDRWKMASSDTSSTSSAAASCSARNGSYTSTFKSNGRSSSSNFRAIAPSETNPTVLP